MSNPTPSDLSVLPAELGLNLAELSVSQLAKLAPEHKCAIDAHLDAALATLKKARTKLDAALEQCYGLGAHAN